VCHAVDLLLTLWAIVASVIVMGRSVAQQRLLILLLCPVCVDLQLCGWTMSLAEFVANVDWEGKNAEWDKQVIDSLAANDIKASCCVQCGE
jgi:hypothetical protein